MISKNILFISLNNGSDIRIRKELVSLAEFSKVTFFGISKYKNNMKVKNVKYFNFQRSYKNFFNLILYIKNLINHILKNKFDNLHIVDEELYILLFFFLLFLKPFKKLFVILDVFDSIYLKNNISPFKINKLFFKLYLSQIDQLIITDQNRLQLYPKSLDKIKNAITLENYPYKVNIENNISIKNTIYIAYIGTLSKARGSLYLSKLLKRYENVKIVSMGLVCDEFTSSFLKNNNKVSFYGNLSTDEMNNILIKNVHYLFLYYPPTSLNNIYSSPNKIYDAINLNIPILVNNDTKSANFVSKNNIGMNYDLKHIMSKNKIEKLIINHKEYKEELKKLKDLDIYNWNFIKYKLIDSHNISQKN